MIITEKRRIGDLGEGLACDWLKRQGFRILDRNYLTKFGEIDIVGQKSGQTVFFEVKTVTSTVAKAMADKRGTIRDRFPDDDLWPDGVSCESKGIDGDYEPEDNIHPWKLKRLARTIEIYLSDKDIDDDEADWQLDCLAVYLDQEGKLLRIERLEDIF